MKEHTNKLELVQHIFLNRNNILIDICQMLLLQLRFDIYSALNEKKTYISTWSDLSMLFDWPKLSLAEFSMQYEIIPNRI